MKSREKIFLFGGSGHAKVVIDVIESMGEFQVAFILDDDERMAGKTLFSYPIVGNRTELLRRFPSGRGIRGFVGVGNNAARESISAWLSNKGFDLVSVIHHRAYLGKGVKIGLGTTVMAGAIVHPDSEIGSGVIINTGSQVDHDCRVGDFTHLAPGSVLCGTVKVGSKCLLGAHSTILPGLEIGNDVVVGAGATVLKSIRAGDVVVGTPAKNMPRDRG